MKSPQRPTRLVKLLLPTDLVRDMDRAILASAGGYQDRSEFVTESVHDRLTEEAALLAVATGESPPTRIVATSDARSGLPPAVHEVGARQPIAAPALAPGGQLSLGEWQREATCTVPARRTAQVNFGLHNRDLPTLWTLNRLATMTSHEPVTWKRFIVSARQEGAGIGERLRLHDLERATPIAVGIGFPKPGVKKEQSLDRFIAAMIGSQGRADGPIFALALADFADADCQAIAPTDAGLAVLGDMIDQGLGTALPQPQVVFERWWRHLAEWAPAERAAWHKVLRVVAINPDREALVSHFPEWRGHTATTNTVGFISRSREWGLVQPQMIEGRYQLTDSGSAVAKEG
ncbi:MAG: ribbon-helix-helix domain-containing protein [Chloroflexota bacterium]|nr:ribbon-helix-helix domain-containing protein [Chloroflexota bacterium]